MPDRPPPIAMSDANIQRIVNATRWVETNQAVTDRPPQVRRRGRREPLSAWMQFTVDADFTTSDSTFLVTPTLFNGINPGTDPGVEVQNLPSSQGGFVFAGSTGFFGVALFRAADPGEWHCVQLECLPPPPVARGSMELVTPIAGADIGAGWVDVPFDAIETPGVGGVEFDLAQNAFRVTDPGDYQINLYANLSHNETNNSRETNVRLWDLTGGVEIGSVPIPIARNQPGSAINVNLLKPIAVAGDWIRWEIGGGDALTSVFWNSNNTSIVRVD